MVLVVQEERRNKVAKLLVAARVVPVHLDLWYPLQVEMVQVEAITDILVLVEMVLAVAAVEELYRTQIQQITMEPQKMNMAEAVADAQILVEHTSHKVFLVVQRADMEDMVEQKTRIL